MFWQCFGLLFVVWQAAVCINMIYNIIHDLNITHLLNLMLDVGGCQYMFPASLNELSFLRNRNLQPEPHCFYKAFIC